MNELTLVVYTTAAQIEIGKIGDTPIYATCGGCGQAAAMMGGAIHTSDGRLALLNLPGSKLWCYGYLCQPCLEAELRNADTTEKTPDL